MGHQLAYRFTEGEVLRYQVVVHMVLQERGMEPVAGYAEMELRQQAMERHDDYTWTLEMRTDVTQFDGILQGNVPDWLTGKLSVFRMDAQGALIESVAGAPPSRLVLFPNQPVEEGSSWTVTDPSTGAAMDVTYVVHTFEPTDDGVVASLVSTAATSDPQEGLTTTVESTMSFAVDVGCHLGSTTVIESRWESGRTCSVVVESQLLERGVAESGSYLG